MPKIQIRSSIFETNSSSVHTVAIATEDLFQQWKDGKVMYLDYAYRWEDGKRIPISHFLPTEEAIEFNLERAREIAKNADKWGYVEILEKFNKFVAEHGGHYVNLLEEDLIEFVRNALEGYLSFEDHFSYVDDVMDCESYIARPKVEGGTGEEKLVVFGYSGYN